MTAQQHEPASLTPLCHIASSIGMLGYGVDFEQTEASLARLVPSGVPTALILDSGSTDSGPEKLAIGGMTMPRSSYERDLRKLYTLSRRYDVPLIFSSAGGSGLDKVTRDLTELVKELADDIGTGSRPAKIVSIYSNIPKDTVKQRLREGAITSCGKSVPLLTESDLEACPNIAAQMGYEPFLDALNEHPDLAVLVGGRAYDPVPFVAFAEHCLRRYTEANSTTSQPPSKEDRALLLGGFHHMGKILECAGACAKPKGGGAVATVYTDGRFEISPMDPEAVCTPLSVAAHTLYEKSRPDKLYGPGGYLDLTKAQYAQLDDKRSVLVSGGLFVSTADDPDTSSTYQVKLEGAKTLGYRASYMGMIKDPVMISQLEPFLEDTIRGFVAKQHEAVSDPWDLQWRIYGDKPSTGSPTQVFLVGESLAPTQELATSIVATAKIGTIHGPYEGQKATSGNFGHGLGGVSTHVLGPCATFCVYHLMDLQPGEERGSNADGRSLFRVEHVTLEQSPGRNQKQQQENGSSSAEEVDGDQPHTTTTKRQTRHQTRSRNAAAGIKPPSLPQARPPTRILDIAQVIRSKNAGPYEITFDIMFESEAVYRAVRDAGLLTPEVIAELYKLSPEQVIWSGFFDQALAYKATIPRMRKGVPVAAGGYLEDDVHGSQMHPPLMQLQLPGDLSQKLDKILAEAEKATEA